MTISLLVVLLSGMITLPDNPAELKARTINVPVDYNTIQSAIDASASGDTIRIGEGSFKERITIDKPLTLQGAGIGKTFLIWDNDDDPPIIQIRGPGPVNISGFEMRPSKALPTVQDRTRAKSYCVQLEADIVRIKQIRIRGHDRKGISISKTSFTEIVDSIFCNCPLPAIDVRPRALNCMIARSTFIDCYYCVRQVGGIVSFCQNHVLYSRQPYSAIMGHVLFANNLIEASGNMYFCVCSQARIKKNLLLEIYNDEFSSPTYSIEQSSKLFELSENIFYGVQYGIRFAVEPTFRCVANYNWITSYGPALVCRPSQRHVLTEKDPPVELNSNTIIVDSHLKPGVSIYELPVVSMKNNVISNGHNIPILFDQITRLVLANNAFLSNTRPIMWMNSKVLETDNQWFSPITHAAQMSGQEHLPKPPLRREHPPDYRIEGVNWHARLENEDGKSPVITMVRPQPWMIGPAGSVKPTRADSANMSMIVAGFVEDSGGVDVVLINGKPSACAPIARGIAFLTEVELAGQNTPVEIRAVDLAGNHTDLEFVICPGEDTNAINKTEAIE